MLMLALLCTFEGMRTVEFSTQGPTDCNRHGAGKDEQPESEHVIIIHHKHFQPQLIKLHVIPPGPCWADVTEAAIVPHNANLQYVTMSVHTPPAAGLSEYYPPCHLRGSASVRNVHICSYTRDLELTRRFPKWSLRRATSPFPKAVRYARYLRVTSSS